MMRLNLFPFFIGSFLIAQELVAESAFDSNDNHYLKTVVITAVKPTSALTFELNPKKARQPVPAGDGSDYLKTVPGFNSIRNGGTNSDPVLRGMFGSRLNVLTNAGGMPGACPSRMDNTLSYISPENYDRLIITKGPQTVLWGPGSSAGTVRFEREATSFDEGKMALSGSVMGGSFGRSDQVVDLAMGNPQGFLRLNGNRSESNNFKDGSGEKVASAWKKWSSDVSLGLTPDKHTLIELSVGQGDGEAHYAGRAMDGSQFLRESFGFKYQKEQVSPVVESISLNLYSNSVDHVMDNYSLRNRANQSAMPMASNVRRETIGGRLALDWASQSWGGSVGIDSQLSDHWRRSAAGIDLYREVSFIKDAVLANYGLFSEMTYSINDDRRFVFGTRLDESLAKDNRSLIGSGMLAMSNPTQGIQRTEVLTSGFIRFEHDQTATAWSWYSGIGYVERMPDYWELFSANASQRGLNGFSGVDIERTSQLDIGLQYVSPTWNAWLSAYVGNISDYILFTYENSGMMGSSSTVSNIEAMIKGVEAGIEYQLTPNWKIDSSLAYSWGVNRSKDMPLPQMPPLDIRIALGYESHQWQSGLLLRAVLSQDRIAIKQGNVVGRDLSESDRFVVLSINSAYKISSQFVLSAGVDNVLNTHYSEHLNLAGNADFGFPSEPTRFSDPGRNIWFKLTFNF